MKSFVTIVIVLALSGSVLFGQSNDLVLNDGFELQSIDLWTDSRPAPEAMGVEASRR